MLHVNDHRDDLFRRAADNYPLNTGTGDWEALRKKMDAPADEEAAVVIVTGKKNYSWLLLLLLLPIGVWLGSNFQKQQTANKDSSRFGSAGNVAPLPSATDNKNVQSPKNNIQSKKFNSISAVAEPYPRFIRKLSDQHIVPANLRPDTGDKTIAQDITEQHFEIPASIRIQISPARAVDMETAGISASSMDDLTQKTTALNTKTPLADLIPGDSAREKKDSSKTITAKEKAKRSASIFAGVIGGPDVSSIKGQRAEKMGWTLGIVAGMSWKKHWQIETGALMTQKYYGTNGEYFGRSKLTIPATTKIEYAEGYCRMLEIPLNIQYKFLLRQHGYFFGGTGLSSYIMQKEHYTFDVVRYGNRYPYEASYSKTSHYLFAALNLNIGYAYKFGKSFEARIQPYFKIPMANIGIGSLPIKSTGLLVGITKTIF
ncbi:MAG: hypothetical protein JWQ27_949 [Ferruginibacter sp.]|nr:hypothetical protein [Ferruginibacter sp.]